MVKTALEMTVEEWQAYDPAAARERLAQQTRSQTGERWQQAWRVARRAAKLLRRDFGATRVVVFGSLAHRAWFTPWSDIDLAAWDIPAARFYSAVAAVTGLSPAFKVDLVDPESCQPALRQALDREGIEL
jgi:predicted nucleotidyltransferase